MLKVFKFGGASVKDADAVRNVASILSKYAPPKLVVIVSAMGKTTNALEKVLNAWYNQSPELDSCVEAVIRYHRGILTDLFPDSMHPVYFKTDMLFGELEGYVSSPGNFYDYDYDQLVSLGEMISSTIISEYLLLQGFDCRFADARNFIRTDSNWREGKVDWDTTRQLIANQIEPLLQDSESPILIVTQGFIGSDETGQTTTLGREGSDYSAAIMSHVLNAREMTVWKDVPGVLNADPKYFENTSLLSHISYREAIELTYYGASVIHPKTIKPLQNSNIPLHVRSFLQPEAPGTTIGPATGDDDRLPSIILKSQQVILSFSPKDFSFIAEDNLSEIFAALAKCKIRANMMQTSAISFTICMDENEHKMQKLIGMLGEKFGCRYNNGLQLITIRHYDQNTVSRLLEGRTLLVEQRSRSTAQFVVKEKQ